jgi:CHAT domain-containing protein
MRRHELRSGRYGWLLFLVALVAGCASSYRMGDPVQVDAHAKAPPASASAAPSGQAGHASATQPARGEYRSGHAEHEAEEWAAKWQQIQSSSDTVKWDEHFHVCGLKYRFRNYDQLFRCLDLLDAKTAAGGDRVEYVEIVRRGAPIVTGWLRASAYAELGEPETALKWAESAWAALPEGFRAADIRVTDYKMFGGMKDKDVESVYGLSGYLGSTGWGGGDSDVESMQREGRDNPAALDLRPWRITMELATQRSLLYQQLGQTEKARAALADLQRWQKTRWRTSHVLPFRGPAQMLSLGPSFSQGDYARVVYIYEAIARKVGNQRGRERAKDAAEWALFLPLKLLYEGLNSTVNHLVAKTDVRLFAVAMEDVSNALVYSQSLIRLGRVDKAREMLDTLLAMPELRAMGNLYWVTLYERARISLQQGHPEEGIRLLEQSVEAIESVRSTISFEAAKIGFAGDKQAVYASLIGALAHSGDWQGAFVYAERAKARALVDLLAQRRDLGPPQSSDEKVRALFASAAAVDSGVGLASSDESVRGIKVVADARDALSTAAPEAASLISVQKVDVAAISARMGPQETLVDYYTQGDDLYAFVLNAGTIKGHKLSARGLEEEVRAFREAIGRREPRALELGQSLHTRLIDPLIGDITGPSLTIAPHGALHYLPFAALSDGKSYLIDRYAVRLIPSADTLVYLRSERRKTVGTLLALGNPDLGKPALDLPNAQVEAVKVASMFPDSRALVRAEASKSAVKDLGGGFSILHFATHGRFDADAPLSSGLYLAKGNEANGVLTVSDLYSLRWDVDLVTLSACETGLGKVANGDDVIGLTRGFLYAGARSIVASLWEVDDAATAQLMETFYRNLGSNDKREALRLAQIETRKQYPDPWYWAAFNVLGRAD